MKEKEEVGGRRGGGGGGGGVDLDASEGLTTILEN